MNIVFFLLVIAAAVLLWFLLSFSFIPLGRISYRIWKDVCGAMNKKIYDEKGEEDK